MNWRMLAALDYRESDRCSQQEVLTWTRYRPRETRKEGTR